MMLRIRFKIWCMSHKRARKAKKAEKVEIERAKRMLKPIFETLDNLLSRRVRSMANDLTTLSRTSLI